MQKMQCLPAAFIRNPGNNVPMSLNIPWPLATSQAACSICSM
jgi:hypothetical protein